MADLADVSRALVGLIVGAVYPDGTAQPSVFPIAGGSTAVRVGRAWPLKQTLDADLKAGVVNISVVPIPGMERNTTRFSTDWQTIQAPVHTMTATVAGDVITLGGTVSVAQNVAVLFGNASYTHAVQTGDTPSSIAATLATLISADTPATSSGAAITVPNVQNLTARIGGVGVVARELRRQQRVFQVTLWCNTPEQRDLISPVVDMAFAGLSFVTMPDGFAARVIYQRTMEIDRGMLESLFRRDLNYLVEYATTQANTAPEIVVFETDVIDQNDAPLATINT